MRRWIALTLAVTACAAVSVLTFGKAPSAAGRAFLEIGRAHAEFAPVLSGERPIFILILGSDSRPGTPLEGGLSDSIHILGINPKSRRATLIGIPRDSKVLISPGGTEDKINVAMFRGGGPEGAIATVENLTGITFDYYMLTGFDELIAAVNQIGGLRIDIPYAFEGYQRNFEKGMTRLDGAGALGFSRTRHSLQGGDFDRSMNQGRLMVAALTQFRGQFAKDPTALFTWLGAGMRNVRTDLSLDELLALGFTTTDIPPKRVTNMVLIGTSALEGGRSVVLLSDINRGFYEDIASDGYIDPKDIPEQAQPDNGNA